MIKGKNIWLRAPEPEDVPIIYRWENDPEVRIISSFQQPVSAFAIEQYILNAGQNPFAVGDIRFMAMEKSTHAVIGHVDLFDLDPVNRRAGVGILLEKEFRGKGYAGEMLQLIETWCRQELDLHQLWCTITTDNQRSIRLFTRAGFRKTGIRYAWTRREGKWVDEVFMQKGTGNRGQGTGMDKKQMIGG